MTRLQMLTEVVSNIGRTDKTAEINRAINLALADLGQLHEFREMRSETDLAVVAGDSYVSLPGTAYALIEARLINATFSNPIYIGVKQTLLNFFPNIAAITTGNPLWGYVESGKLYLIPRPSSSGFIVRVTTKSMPTDLAADGDSSTIPLIHTAIIPWVTAYMFTQLQQYQDAAQWHARADRATLTLIRMDKTKPAQKANAQEFMQLSPSQLTPAYLNPFAQRDNS